jgi:hypothetical protein
MKDERKRVENGEWIIRRHLRVYYPLITTLYSLNFILPPSSFFKLSGWIGESAMQRIQGWTRMLPNIIVERVFWFSCKIKAYIDILIGSPIDPEREDEYGSLFGCER